MTTVDVYATQHTREFVAKDGSRFNKYFDVIESKVLRRKSEPSRNFQPMSVSLGSVELSGEFVAEDIGRPVTVNGQIYRIVSIDTHMDNGYVRMTATAVPFTVKQAVEWADAEWDR